ncbi:MAG: RDD family protein [Firmicutes bacterium]|nr:RDD family protein [Bacillota bacterium]
MKTVTVITPANIEVEYKLAGVGARLAALIIDSLLQLLAVALCARVLFGINRQTGHGVHYSTILAIFLVVSFLIYFGYFIVCEMLMNGQTVGKRMFGLRVVRDNGQPIEFSQSLLRGVIRSTLDMMYVGLFVILFSKKHKRLGDMAAGTIVIIERYNTEFFDPMFDTQDLDFPEFLPPLMDMTKDERAIVVDWLRRRETLPDYGMEIGEKLAEYFERKDGGM